MFKNQLEKKFPNAELYNLQHATRLNGVVDVWKNHKTVYCIPDNEYKNFEEENNSKKIKYIKECLEKHEKRNPIKKLKSGRMSYQEFINNRRQ